MTRHTKLFGLLSIVVVAPIAFASSASAQYRIENAQFEITPNSPVLIPAEPLPIDPDWCGRICPYVDSKLEIEIDFIEPSQPLDPVVQDINVDELERRTDRFRNVGRSQYVKYDEFWKAPVLDPSGESLPPQTNDIEQYLKFDD